MFSLQTSSRRVIAGVLLADVQIVGEAVDLSLSFTDDIVKLIGLPLHGSVEELSLVQSVANFCSLSSNLSIRELTDKMPNWG